MTEDEKTGVFLGLGLLALVIAAVLFVALYILLSFCYKRICEKRGKKPGALIWIPIVRMVPLLQIAGMPDWFIILLLLPLVNFVVFLVLWARICTVLGKSPWLVIMFFIPILNLVLIPYLAFSDSSVSNQPPASLPARG